MEEIIYQCPICKSTNVQGKAWVDLNGKKPDIEFFNMSDEEDFWCIDCEKHIIPIQK